MVVCTPLHVHPTPFALTPTTHPHTHALQEGVSASLDALRAGDAGEPIPRDAVPAASLFTNGLLPA